MKIYRAGDKSKAICEHCGSLVSTTFAYRDVPFGDGSGVVKAVLAAVCDRCDHVVALPAQSTPAVRRAREVADIPLEVTLAAPEMDLLDLAVYRIDSTAGTKLRKTLIAYYLRRISTDSESIGRLQQNFLSFKTRQAGAKASPTKRLSLKLAPRTDDNLKVLMSASGLKKSEVIRSVIGEIEKDLVLPDHPKDLERFREIADVLTA